MMTERRAEMERLTHERLNGIRDGYWSPNKKQELVDRLAAYENTDLDPEQVEHVKETAKKYLLEKAQGKVGGWIPVEERLPEVFGKYWATIRYDDGRISEPIVVDFRGVRQKYVVNTPNGREYETWGIDSAFHGSRVIAWRPYYIPEPYRPERSET